MNELCPRCLRTKGDARAVIGNITSCYETDAIECRAVEAAYRRGIARGVAIAKEHVEARYERDDEGNRWHVLDWSEVDRAVDGEGT